MTDFNNPGKLFLFIFSLRRMLAAKTLRKYCESLGFRGYEHVLEPGSGTGSMTKYLSRKLMRGGSVTCVDPSAPLMNVARRDLKMAYNIVFIPGEIHAVETQRHGFDACVIHYMLHDVDSRERAAFLRKMHELLSSEGRVYLREPVSARHGMPVDEILSLMDDAGFIVVSSRVSGRIIRWSECTAVFVKKPD